MHQYILRIESEEPLGKFLDTAIEQFLSDEEHEVSVEVIDPTIVPENLL